MSKRDLNRRSAHIVQEPTDYEGRPAADAAKDLAAVESGRRGCQEGVRARAAKLIAEQRSGTTR